MKSMFAISNIALISRLKNLPRIINSNEPKQVLGGQQLCLLTDLELASVAIADRQANLNSQSLEIMFCFEFFKQTDLLKSGPWYLTGLDTSSVSDNQEKKCLTRHFIEKNKIQIFNFKQDDHKRSNLAILMSKFGTNSRLSSKLEACDSYYCRVETAGKQGKQGKPPKVDKENLIAQGQPRLLAALTILGHHVASQRTRPASHALGISQFAKI